MGIRAGGKRGRWEGDAKCGRSDSGSAAMHHPSWRHSCQLAHLVGVPVVVGTGVLQRAQIHCATGLAQQLLAAAAVAAAVLGAESEAPGWRQRLQRPVEQHDGGTDEPLSTVTAQFSGGSSAGDVGSAGAGA